MHIKCSMEWITNSGYRGHQDVLDMDRDCNMIIKVRDCRSSGIKSS